jgi:hypothetical protein
MILHFSFSFTICISSSNNALEYTFSLAFAFMISNLYSNLHGWISFLKIVLKSLHKVHYYVQKAYHWFLYRARCFQPTPSYPTSLRSILILSSHLHLGLTSGVFLSDYPIKLLYAFLISPMCATWPAHLILLHLITLIIFCEAYSYEALYYAIFSSFLSLHPP